MNKNQVTFFQQDVCHISNYNVSGKQNRFLCFKMAVKANKGQICDGTISKVHVTRGYTICVESCMGLWKSAQFIQFWGLCCRLSLMWITSKLDWPDHASAFFFIHSRFSKRYVEATGDEAITLLNVILSTIDEECN